MCFNSTLKVFQLILFAIVVSGCTAIQPFQMAARAGDTISLAIGSAEDMNVSNTTITFISDADPLNPVDFSQDIRSIFNLYPDKTSSTWILDTTWITSGSGHGAWQTVLVADLPPNLQLGPGKILVDTSATFPNLLPHVNNMGIPIEILPGTGISNPFAYDDTDVFEGDPIGDFSKLQPMRRATVKMQPGGNGGPAVVDSTKFAGAEIRVNYPLHDQSGNPVNDNRIYLVLDERYNNLISKLQMTWNRVGDDITVIFLSADGKARLHEIHFYIVDRATDATVGSPSLLSAKYWDMDGVEFTGPDPSVEGPI